METVSLFIEHFPYIGLFILLILGGIGLPFPEDATLILCGFLISTEAVKPVNAVTAVYAGLLTADIIIYSFGRKYGRMVVTRKFFHRIISPEKLLKLEDQFNRRGIYFVLFGRHLIGFRAQIFLVSGIMRMPLLKFMVSDAVSAIFTMALMIGIGYAGGNSLQVLKKDMTRIKYAVAFVITVIITIYLVFNYFKSKKDKT